MRKEETPPPWYRQFWPWFIIMLPASAVVASLYTVSLAIRTTDSLVIDAEDGVDVVTERNLAAERAAQDLGLAASIAIDAASGAVTVDVSGRNAISDNVTLELLFSHPTNARRDQTITVSPAPNVEQGTARWVGHFVEMPSGRFYVVLTSGDNWRLSGSWNGAGRIVLEPSKSGNGA